MILIALPFFLFAIYEKDGRPLEKVLKNIILQKFVRPGIRPYKTDNFYAAIQKEIYEKEVLGIEATQVQKHESRKVRKKAGSQSGSARGNRKN